MTSASAIFPFSKLLHAPGVFFSPGRNQADNPREQRHLAPWAAELEKAKTDLVIKEAQVRKTEAMIESRTMRSPVDGIVTEMGAGVGLLHISPGLSANNDIVWVCGKAAIPAGLATAPPAGDSTETPLAPLPATTLSARVRLINAVLPAPSSRIPAPPGERFTETPEVAAKLRSLRWSEYSGAW